MTRKPPNILTLEQIAASGTEHAHQAALFAWCKHPFHEGRLMPELDLLYAIPNGGARTSKFGQLAAGARMRAEGVKAGVPDLCLPVARRGWHSIYIEMKRGRNTLEGMQKQWLAGLFLAGNCCGVAYSWQEGAELLSWYLGRTNKRPVGIIKAAQKALEHNPELKPLLQGFV